MKRLPYRAAGFTLIELLVSVAILGILASITLPITESVQRYAKERELRDALRAIRAALDRYKAASDAGHIARSADSSGYPPDLMTLVHGVADAKDPRGGRLYFLRRVPRNPMAAAELPPEASWGLRSYRSPPDDPRPGADVFDVFVDAPGVGSNGVAYSKW
jgi:general secretion pathway protein G